MESSFWAKNLLLLSGLLSVTGCSPRPAKPLWNLPPLIGQPMDVAKKTLGQPQSEATPTPGLTTGIWKQDDTTLTATWKTSNGRVTAYELHSRDDDHALREGETAELLVPGQLKENDPSYSTELIEATNRPLFYTGVKVTPAPKTHNVIIRLTGSEALLQVIYQATGQGGKSDDIITIAPWETNLTLPDDASVSVLARVSQTINQQPVQMKVEILVDGKVAATQASNGQSITCKYDL